VNERIRERNIVIKGNNDKLIFYLNDKTPFKSLLEELQEMLEKKYSSFLNGPLMHITLKIGKRELTAQEEKEIRNIIKMHGNLVIQHIEKESEEQREEDNREIANKSSLKVITGIVRSGQELVYDGDLLWIGDVNPGGWIYTTGDLYVLGEMKGNLHVGANGNRTAIAIAYNLKPSQVRIADIISKNFFDIFKGLTFAHLEDNEIKISPINKLERIRPEMAKNILQLKE